MKGGKGVRKVVEEGVREKREAGNGGMEEWREGVGMKGREWRWREGVIK